MDGYRAITVFDDAERAVTTSCWKRFKDAALSPRESWTPSYALQSRAELLSWLVGPSSTRFYGTFLSSRSQRNSIPWISSHLKRPPNCSSLSTVRISIDPTFLPSLYSSGLIKAAYEFGIAVDSDQAVLESQRESKSALGVFAQTTC